MKIVFLKNWLVVWTSHKTFVDCGISIMNEKITPETYKKMNEEFEEEGLPFRIIVPTQEQIDKWRNESDHLQQ